MRIGIPKESGIGEGRVSITNSEVNKLVAAGHKVYVMKNAGIYAGISDNIYKESGAEIVEDIKELYNKSTLIVKVKIPSLLEQEYIGKEHILFSFILPYKNPKFVENMLNKKVTAIAYENIKSIEGEAIIKNHMSTLAGKIALLFAGKFLQSNYGGMGILLGDTLGSPHTEVVILGAASGAYAAAKTAYGLGCNVTVLNRSVSRLEYIKDRMSSITCLKLKKENIHKVIKKADIIINTIDLKGQQKEHIIEKRMLKNMKRKSVIIDMACDVNGAIESIKKTSHKEPTYMEDGVIHCAISNLPGIVPATASKLLGETIEPYIKYVANEGLKKSMFNNRGLRSGLCMYDGFLLDKKTAKLLNVEYSTFEEAF
ncbi:NAD(P)-dependent oxidoreductase [Anaeromicrobium sediminis]|uniref:Uncharacterized protein n=1 Tax=Anaeromicrobium sediminis TaxID=1478221 RepID=A0A267MK84_9FIRM|nr:NAD(P)-dependent oxidoreductase [Anaeromicrobium sediminis]PAB59200.1 hypothetical protein CCE28_11825 [Anaeromicrobium sediminis]